MEKIIIKNLEIFAYHGVNPEEKQNGQRFLLDLTLWADLSQGWREQTDSAVWHGRSASGCHCQPSLK